MSLCILVYTLVYIGLYHPVHLYYLTKSHLAPPLMAGFVQLTKVPGQKLSASAAEGPARFRRRFAEETPL